MTVVLLMTVGFICRGDDAAAGTYRFSDLGKTPFEMSAIRDYVFPAHDFRIDDYGARPDGTKCTEAIARAIDSCATAGGGRVVVPAGTWFTGPVHLRSNVDLHLEPGARLLFSDDPKDFLPAVRSSWEGLECMNYSPLVYAYGCTNVALTGSGVVEAKMDFWKAQMEEGKTDIQGARRILYTWGATDYPVEKRVMPSAHPAVMRPQLIQFNRSANVLIEGIEVRDSPFWTMHLLLCDNVIVRNVRVRAHGFNNDGIDIEMTRNVLVEGGDYDQGDDAFVFKAGRNRDAWRIGRPTENVVVRNCRVRKAGSLVGVGSELSGGVRNIYVHDCKVGEVARLYYVKTNHRRGGFVENVVLRNVDVAKGMWKAVAVETDVLYQWREFPDYETRYTKISNLTVENVHCAAAKAAIDVLGDPHEPIRGIRIKDLSVDRIEDVSTRIENAVDVQVDGFRTGTVGKVPTSWDDDLPTVCKVVDCAGVPRLELNGEAVSGTAVMPSPRVKPDESRSALVDFATNGVRLSSDIWTMRPPQPKRQWWLGDGVYDECR